MVLKYLIRNKNLETLIRFFRLKLSFPMSLPYFFGAIMADKKSIFRLKTYIIFVPVLLSSMSGTLLNDYRDYFEDLKNPKKSDKPLITGEIPKECALICGIILLIFAVLTTFLIFKSLILSTLPIIFALGYYFLKSVPPFDLIINNLLLPMSILSGWYSATYDCFDIKLMTFLILFSNLFYLNGAIFDYNYDKTSTVKTLGKLLSLYFLFVTLIASLYILPKKLLISKISIILLQLTFILVTITRNWKLYTYITCISGMLLFSNILLKGF